MRVLHVITTLDRGGAERQLLLLAREQVAAGLDVGVLALSGRGLLIPEFTSAGVKVWRTSTRGASRLRGALIVIFGTLTLRKLLKQYRPDIIHAHLPHAELVASLAVPRNRPRVHTRHVTPPFYATKVRLSPILSRVALRKRPHVVAISQAVERRLITSGEVPLSTTTSVILYGYDSSRTPTASSETRYVQSSAPLLLGTVGRLVPQKGHDLLLQALASPVIRSRDWKLVIAGGGPEEGSLRRLAEDLNLSDRVTFLGEIGNPEDFISRLDIFAFPSRFEGFGLVLLEAMACGVPIVASDSTAIPEVVSDGKSALLFATESIEDLARQLTRLWDPALRKSLSDTALAILSTDFNIRRVSREHEQLYLSLLNDS